MYFSQFKCTNHQQISAFDLGWRLSHVAFWYHCID